MNIYGTNDHKFPISTYIRTHESRPRSYVLWCLIAAKCPNHVGITIHSLKILFHTHMWNVWLQQILISGNKFNVCFPNFNATRNRVIVYGEKSSKTNWLSCNMHLTIWIQMNWTRYYMQMICVNFKIQNNISPMASHIFHSDLIVLLQFEAGFGTQLFHYYHLLDGLVLL